MLDKVYSFGCCSFLGSGPISGLTPRITAWCTGEKTCVMPCQEAGECSTLAAACKTCKAAFDQENMWIGMHADVRMGHRELESAQDCLWADMIVFRQQLHCVRVLVVLVGLQLKQGEAFRTCTSALFRCCFRLSERPAGGRIAFHQFLAVRPHSR